MTKTCKRGKITFDDKTDDTTTEKNDSEVRNIMNKLHKEKSNAKMFILHEGVLCRLWTEERDTFWYIFIPEVLRDLLLVLAHKSKQPQQRATHVHGSEENVLLARYEKPSLQTL